MTSVITNWQSSARGCFRTSLTHPSIRGEISLESILVYSSASTICHSLQCFICTLIYYCHIKYQLSILCSTVRINISSEPHEVSAKLDFIFVSLDLKSKLQVPFPLLKYLQQKTADWQNILRAISGRPKQEFEKREKR